MPDFKNLLKQKEIKNTVLAKRLNKSKSLISQWCNGTKMPSLNDVVKMSKILNISISKLVLMFVDKERE